MTLADECAARVHEHLITPHHHRPGGPVSDTFTTTTTTQTYTEGEAQARASADAYFGDDVTYVLESSHGHESVGVTYGGQVAGRAVETTWRFESL